MTSLFIFRFFVGRKPPLICVLCSNTRRLASHRMHPHELGQGRALKISIETILKWQQSMHYSGRTVQFGLQYQDLVIKIIVFIICHHYRQLLSSSSSSSPSPVVAIVRMPLIGTTLLAHSQYRACLGALSRIILSKRLEVPLFLLFVSRLTSSCKQDINQVYEVTSLVQQKIAEVFFWKGRMM